MISYSENCEITTPKEVTLAIFAAESFSNIPKNGFVKDGYIFLGWFIADADGNATSEKFTDTVWNRLDGLSLIAQWEEDFSTNDGYTDRY